MNVREELEDVLETIELLIESVRQLAKDMGVPAETLRDTSGGLLLAPLVTHKASVLVALANLRPKGLISYIDRRA